MENLKYYMFDWDDNILHMKTKINVIYKGKPTIIFPVQFPHAKNDSNYVFPENCFDEMLDSGPRGKNAFHLDVMDAMVNLHFAPSWDMFIEALLNGRIFMIITARGHEPEIIKQAIKVIIEQYMSNLQRKRMVDNLIKYNQMFNIEFDLPEIINQYLDRCEFLGTASKAFEKKYGVSGMGKQPGPYKTIAIQDFIKRANKFGERVNRDVLIGFSDDDSENIRVITKYLKTVDESRIKGIYVYDTSNPDFEGGLKRIVRTVKQSI